ncbi:inverted formin-2-like [Salvelinus namaycush]|uniref:Inverted formin-2-like n=1 Tax=Salvelinus namaycush TaxID=8040 RepID=A0A8U0TVX9_SALNM|nr:inverted formin-2-like [Salvelinus namaycush]
MRQPTGGPPPPPGIGFGLSTGRQLNVSKMRNFNWDAIPKHVVVGKHNIWTEEKTLGEYELDTQRIEELFSHSQQQGQGQKALNRQSIRGKPTNSQGTEVVSILNSKRSMNVGIFLKQFKRPVGDMIKDISSGNGLKFGTGKLKELCKLLPEKEEVKQLVGFKGDQSALPEADLFMMLLIKVPSYEERLNSLVLKEEFFPLMDEMKQSIATMITAGKELLESDDLHSVIRLVLKTGNYMNAGGYAGSAIGFRMASLLKLVDTRANKPGMNLMHYVVMQAQKVDVALLKFPDKLTHIADAARIHKEDIESEFQREVKKVKEAKEEAQKQEELRAQMEDFLEEAECRLAETELSLQSLGSVSDSVAEYFCEDPSKFRLDECCSIFNSFCEKFLRAIQENRDREVAEVKRRTRDRLLSDANAAKRRSTATCSIRDKDMEGVALESVLRKRKGSGMPSPTISRLSEVPIQANLPSAERGNRSCVKATEVCKENEWNSARDLAGTSQSDQKDQSHSKRNRRENVVPHPEETQQNPKKPDGSTQPTRRTGSSSSSSCTSTGRPISVTMKDKEEKEEEEGNEEEAQKLREVSRKVLRYQSSRGSLSSGEYGLEQQKSPNATNNTNTSTRSPNATTTNATSSTISTITSTSPHQRTFQEDRQRLLGDACRGSESLARYLLNPHLSPKEILTRRHTFTLPPKAPPTEEEEEDDLFTFPTTPSPILGVIGGMKSVDTDLMSLKHRASGGPNRTNLPGHSEKSCVRDLVSKSPMSKHKDLTASFNIPRDSENRGLEVPTTPRHCETSGVQRDKVSNSLSAAERPTHVEIGELNQDKSSSIVKTKPPPLHLELNHNQDEDIKEFSPAPLQILVSQEPKQADPPQSPKHNMANPSKSRKTKLSEGNGFMSFFKHLGERSKPM